MSHQGRTHKSRQGIGGPATIEGRKNQIASRLAYGVKANSPVLPGIEDHLEWERFRKGFWTLWQPVGIPEEECVDQIAGEYWIMRRIRRWETATSFTQLYELAASEPNEVRREITRLLGEPVIRQNVFGNLEDGDRDNDEAAAYLAGNGNGDGTFTPSVAWWRKIIESPNRTPVTHAEASWLMELVLEQVLPAESEDSENDDAAGFGSCDDPEPAFTLPSGKITIGELRRQLSQLGAASQQGDTPSVEEILTQGYQAAQEEAHSLELARIRARRFISERTLLPENRINTALVYKRQTMCLISRHMAILERLQAKRAGQFVPPPAMVDVNMTVVPREDSP
jgi:ribulose bisphosphate carboxylase small subunit